MTGWTAQDWFAAAAFVLSLLSIAGSGAAYFMRNTSKGEAEDAIKPLEDKINDHERRITTLEAREEDRPTKDDLHALSREVAELRGEMKSFGERFESYAGEMKGVRSSIEGVKDYLLTKRND